MVARDGEGDGDGEGERSDGLWFPNWLSPSRALTLSKMKGSLPPFSSSPETLSSSLTLKLSVTSNSELAIKMWDFFNEKGIEMKTTIMKTHFKTQPIFSSIKFSSKPKQEYLPKRKKKKRKSVLFTSLNLMLGTAGRFHSKEEEEEQEEESL